MGHAKTFLYIQEGKSLGVILSVPPLPSCTHSLYWMFAMTPQAESLKYVLGGWHLTSDNTKCLKYAKAMSHTLHVQRLQQSDVLTHVGKDACNGLDV